MNGFEQRAFVGLNGRTGQDVDVPDHFVGAHRDDLRENRRTFSQMYHELPRSYKTEVAYRNPQTGEWIETERFEALYNPDTLDLWDAWDEENRQENEEYDPLWNVPTDSYAIVNPVDFYEPLEQALMEEEITDVFGYANLDKRGGEAHINLMFSGGSAVPEEATNALYTGIRTGYSHLGNVSCYAEGFAQDGVCANSMYGLTDRKSRRHVGSAREEVVEWWEDVLTAYGAIDDHLAEIIENALEFEVNLHEDLPFDQWSQFFEMHYPEYMARSAASHATSRADSDRGPFVLNGWELHSGATYAITHTFSGNEESDTRRDYVRMANDLLQNPALVIDETEREYQRRLQQQGDEDGMFTKEGLELIEDTSDSIEELKQEYEVRQEEMEQLLVAPEE